MGNHVDCVKAIREGNLEKISRILKGKTLENEVKEIDKHEKSHKKSEEKWLTLLEEACKTDKPKLELIKFLLELKADVNHVDEDKGRSALHWLCENKSASSELVSLLVSHGADVNVKDKSGDTPMHLSISSMNFSVLDALIEYNPHPNSVNSDFESALCQMARSPTMFVKQLNKYLRSEESALRTSNNKNFFFGIDKFSVEQMIMFLDALEEDLRDPVCVQVLLELSFRINKNFPLFKFLVHRIGRLEDYHSKKLVQKLLLIENEEIVEMVVARIDVNTKVTENLQNRKSIGKPLLLVLLNEQIELKYLKLLMEKNPN